MSGPRKKPKKPNIPKVRVPKLSRQTINAVQQARRVNPRALSNAARVAQRANDYAEAVRMHSEYAKYLRSYQASALNSKVLEQARQAARVARKGLPESMAAAIADESVHRVRKEWGREAKETKAPPPSPEEIEEWERRRDERRRREAS